MEPRASTAEIAWYRERIPSGIGACLELMCGYGRLLVPLVEAGFNIHGVDVSAAMIAQCEKRFADAALAAPLCRQDAADLNLPFRYGAVLIAAGAFQAVSDAATAGATLARLRAHLIDPALILIDFRVPPEGVQRIAAPLVEFRNASLADGSRIALRSETTMHPDARLAVSERRYVHRSGPARLAEEHLTRAKTWYSREDALTLVSEAGYRDVSIGPPAQPVDEGEAFSIRARA
jgi:SAM-dependent methyltransferase